MKTNLANRPAITDFLLGLIDRVKVEEETGIDQLLKVLGQEKVSLLLKENSEQIINPNDLKKLSKA
jgi:hypothetical protein